MLHQKTGHTFLKLYTDGCKIELSCYEGLKDGWPFDGDD